MPALIVKQSRYFGRCATVCLALLVAGSALADNSKISPDLLPLLANPSKTVNVVVQYNSAPSQCSGGLLGVLCPAAVMAGGRM